MANIAVMVPTATMLEQAERVIKQDGINVHLLKLTKTANILDEVRRAVENGANIVIARGLQAMLIKQHTNIPLVEMKFTGQELGLLVQKAKRIVGKPGASIAFVSFKNLYSDMEHFERLFDIRLMLYHMNSPDDIHRMVELAKSEGADIVIGGDTALVAAESVGIRAMFHDSTEESIREALNVAQRAGYAMDIEKQSNAQLESIMDTSFNGITKIGLDHSITMVNLPMESLLGKTDGKLLGKQIEKEIRGIEMDFINDVLSGEKSTSSTSVRIRNAMLMVVAAPIKYDEKITGAILTFHKMKSMVLREPDAAKETQLHGYLTHYDFSQILRSGQEIRQCIDFAKMYALSKAPIVIYGEDGTEKDVFAGAIHNSGVRRGQPFVSFNCESEEPEDHSTILFGNTGTVLASKTAKGLVIAANYGTLLIHNINRMSALCQSKLARFLSMNSFDRYNDGISAEVRVIVTARRDLDFYCASEDISRELYYALNGLSLHIPPLRSSAEDISKLASIYIKEYSEAYSRFIVVTEQAHMAIAEYPWNGNITQLKRFCERMVLVSGKPHIDEVFVKHCLNLLFLELSEQDGLMKIVVNKHPMAEKIEISLEKHKGNRAKVAKELGISTTTLWRHIKKYGINI